MAVEMNSRYVVRPLILLDQPWPVVMRSAKERDIITTTALCAIETRVINSTQLCHTLSLYASNVSACKCPLL